MLNVLGLGYSETKIKPYLKMAVQRIQLSNNKKTTSVKHQKREVSTLLADHKDEKARIKVEHIIRDDFVIEAYEILELLCDLLHERLRQITSSKDEPPVELRETVYSLVWAASNCDISELQDVQKHLVRKYGTEYFKILGTEAAPTVLNARLFHKLSYTPPSKHLVNQYLGTIAEVYKVDWTPPIEGEAVEDGDDLNSVPYSTPSGFSIPMAPGSGLTGAYTPTASPVSTPASTSLLPPTAQLVGGDGNTRKLTPEEQAEYDDFEKHQKPVYAAVPGPPPHMRKPASAPEFDHKQQWREQQPQQGSAGTAAAVEEAVELKPSGASTASVTSAPAATTSEMAQLERTFKNVTAGDETVRLEDIAPKPMANYEKPPTPPPPPSTTAPPPPPTTTTTTTSPPPPATATGGGDPMDAMLARLAALKKGT